ncbi:MAG: carboxypeptidase regulatory-like domain-containing protein [Cystobacter sp.]
MKREWLFAGVCAVLLFGWGWTARRTSSAALPAAPSVMAFTTRVEAPSPRSSVSGATPGHTAGRIRGHVRDARGPVAGARVLASARVEGETLASLPCPQGAERLLLECSSTRSLSELVLQRVGEAPVLASATTGVEGAFSLENLPPGPHALWVESPEGVALRRDVHTGDEQVTLVLEPGVQVSGLVSGEDQTPVEGALITAIHKLDSRFFEAVSDASGHFALGRLPRGEYVAVVTREGRVPEQLGFLGYMPRVELLPVLEWPRRLSGVVLREGVPVAGVTVSTVSYRDYTEWQERTDARGRFSFNDLPPQSTYDVEATHDGAKASLPVTFTDSNEEDAAMVIERTQVVLELTPTVGLRGRVSDTAGRPLEAARVDVFTTSSEFVATVHTNPQGHYAAEFLAPDTFYIEASAAGHRLAQSLPVAVREGSGHADLVLAPATVLTGRLVDAHERPVVDGALSVHTLDSTEGFHAVSDKDGRFSVDLPAAGRYLLRVNPHSFQAREDLELTAPGDVRVRVEPWLDVRGSVVDETDLPLPGVEVSLWSEDASVTTQHGYRRTDARGRFELSAPSEGTYQLSARFVLGGDLVQAVSRRVVVGPRGVETQLRLEGGHAVSGVVVDSRGHPVGGARVEILAPLQARPAGCGRRLPGGLLTGPDGRLVFQRVSGEGLVLTVTKRGFAPSCRDQPPGRQGISLSPGTREVRVTLVKEASVRGRLVRADGTPVENYELNGSFRNNPQGRFSWEFTCAGPLTLELSELREEPGGARLRRTVTVQEERDLNVGTLVLDAP